MIELYNEDSLSALKHIPDASVDLVVLDPNYNEWDILCRKGLIEQSVRVLKDTGNIICFTKQPFDYNLRISVKDYFRREFVWTFENGGAWVSNKMPLVSTQKIYWLTKSKNFYFQPRTGLDYNEKTKDFKRSTKVFEGYNKEGRVFEKNEGGLWLRDHYHYNKPSFGSIPAKPLELIDIFVKCLSKENDVVLDLFAGSGTTALACKNNNRNFIGYEIDKIVYDVAMSRL